MKIKSIGSFAATCAAVLMCLAGVAFAAGSGGSGNCSGVSNITIGSTTYTPTWCQEFTGAAGPPSTTAWNYDLGNNDGWGNNEVEVYCGQSVAVSYNIQHVDRAGLHRWQRAPDYSAAKCGWNLDFSPHDYGRNSEF